MIERGCDIGFYYDPLYGHIPLLPIYRRALNLDVLQRLRRLKQLGPLDLVFPSATHTRFSHSVGVFHIANLMFESIFDKYVRYGKNKGWPPLSPIHKEALLLAALFHDIGHGPFSHVFEMACKRIEAYKSYKHDFVTKRLIENGIGRYTGVPQFLRRERDRLRKQGATSNELKWLKPEVISALAIGEPPPCDPRYLFLSQIISSTFDADRMDYLRRDAYFTGVETGRVDIWMIINNLILYPLDKSKNIFALGIDRKAASAAEAFVLARDLTYRRVYYNPTHRGVQELIIRAFDELREIYSPEEIVMDTDETIVKKFEEGTSFTKKVAERLKNRNLYDPVPYEFNLYKDLKPYISRIKELQMKREDVYAVENDLKRKLKLPREETVIIDIEPVPLTEREAYTKKLFYDEIYGEMFSLRELLPHLDLLVGTINALGIDLYFEYCNRISDIRVYLPRDLMESFLNNCIEDIRQTGPNLRDYLEQKFHNSIFLIIFNELMELFNVTPKDKKGLLNRYKKRIVKYLERKIRDQI